jgi:signal transduction histidine kinase
MYSVDLLGVTMEWAAAWTVSAWGYLVYAVLVLVLVLVFVWWRTAYLERRREQLEQEVANRTEEVRDQKRQLETYNRELLHTNEQLRRTIEEKSNLLGVAAHDLKNPLFGIRALSEIVLENENFSEKMERKLNLIRESADDSLHLIDDLLASAAGASQADIEWEPVDVAALTTWVVRSFEPQAERKGQVLRCSVSDSACVVEGDRRKLREAIANLVSNALKYSPPGEAVGVSVKRNEGVAEVAVQDAGPGLSEADQERMFAPFQRLGPSPTGDESSSGLGLYIVKQIVDLHDGAVEVDSTLGRGSTFTLRFSAITPDAAPVPEAEPPMIDG